jgi:hypothetical protein
LPFPSQEPLAVLAAAVQMVAQVVRLLQVVKVARVELAKVQFMVLAAAAAEQAR